MHGCHSGNLTARSIVITLLAATFIFHVFRFDLRPNIKRNKIFPVIPVIVQIDFGDLKIKILE